MFQLLRMKFSITACCFQVNSLAVTLANVQKNSSRSLMLKQQLGIWQGLTIIICYLLPSSHIYPMACWLSKTQQIPLEALLLKCPNVTSTTNAPASHGHYQNAARTTYLWPTPKSYKTRFKWSTSTLPFTWGIVPRGWGHRMLHIIIFFTCSFSIDYKYLAPPHQYCGIFHIHPSSRYMVGSPKTNNHSAKH